MYTLLTESTPVSWCQFTGWFQVNTGSPESPSSLCEQSLQKGMQTSPHPAFFLCVCVTVTSRGGEKKTSSAQVKS